MAAAGGTPDSPLDRLLFDEGFRFEFFEAVRLLRRLYPERAAVGHDGPPRRETVRFRSRPALGFAGAAIQELSRDDAAHGRAEMTVNFMGLTGPVGVLPRHYTETVMRRRRARDPVLHEFLDIWTHRFVSLFYRAWEKYRFAIRYERGVVEGKTSDRFAWLLFDLFGMGTDGLLGRLLVDDRVLLYYSGLLAQRRRTASALAGILQDHFAVPAGVEQCIGQWLPIPPRSRTRLGRRGANHQLGASAVLGHRTWDQQAAFRVRLGPFDLRDYNRFLPTGEAFRPLVQMTRYFAGQEHDFDVRLVLRAAEVPRCALGAKGDAGPRLGWSAWLKQVPFVRDADDATFAGELTRVGALRG
ncbi:type VI secretion system baseplate subunit TssG [Candidatus Binatia bacterium]|nr:type VI secretion system baseplate subunit TssG [Candidatus Binatia bacterium]